MTRINLNADMGEGYGAYDIGNDAERPVDHEQQEKHEPEPDERGQKSAFQGAKT